MQEQIKALAKAIVEQEEKGQLSPNIKKELKEIGGA